jgi:serine kinase of HPr protein (carbohydrate metabolism regulator)
MSGFAHQAGCVAIGGRGVLIEGAPGLGKSSLALALVDRGAGFVGDDGVWLCVREGRLWASPHEATRGLIEVRNVGLVPMAVCEAVPVALVVRLGAEAPRYIERADEVVLGGIALPCLTMYPDAWALVLRVEQGLARHGVPF